MLTLMGLFIKSGLEAYFNDFMKTPNVNCKDQMYYLLMLSIFILRFKGNEVEKEHILKKLEQA